jgi:hypothetical protein
MNKAIHIHERHCLTDFGFFFLIILTGLIWGRKINVANRISEFSEFSVANDSR